jgi:hypothetical protein
LYGGISGMRKYEILYEGKNMCSVVWRKYTKRVVGRKYNTCSMLLIYNACMYM